MLEATSRRDQAVHGIGRSDFGQGDQPRLSGSHRQLRLPAPSQQALILGDCYALMRGF